MLIAGGGTAGHVLPGLAVAQALVAAGHSPDTVHWMGSAVGIEARLVPEAGFGVTLLPGRGIERRLSRASIAATWGLTRAAATALSEMKRRRPAVVVSLGGYASAPGAAAAIVFGVPLVLCEQNAVAGAANRLFGPFARATAASFPGTGLARATVTGNPVRPEMLAVDRERDCDEARRALGLPADRTVVAAFGGSLGSRRINLAVLEALDQWADRADLVVRHVVGRRDWAMVSESVPSLPAGGLVYEPVEYEERMDLLLAAADVAVCRAGGSVAELTAVGIPAILVPLPGAPGDHQTANARHLVDSGAAVMVADGELSGARLVAEVNALVDDKTALAAMATASAGAAHRDAAEAVVALIEKHARRD